MKFRFTLWVTAAVLGFIGTACGANGRGEQAKTLVPSEVAPMPSPTSPGSDGFELEYRAGVVASLSFSGVTPDGDFVDGAIRFNPTGNSGEGRSASASLAAAASRDLQVRDLAVRPFGDWEGQALERNGKYVAYRLGAPRSATEPDMSIEGYASELGPGRIITGDAPVTDAAGIEHLPAARTTVSGYDGYYFGQQSIAVGALTTCRLAWFDGSMYWVLTWPCKDSGALGRDEQGLVELAEQGLSFYDASSREFIRQ